ncbi:MAG TPA: hypothetical protein PLF13_04205 [candidate division Zixibacteria bacterium]|nr:hypothetical protein [candidate division Zixibacteria bacterium]
MKSMLFFVLAVCLTASGVMAQTAQLGLEPDTIYSQNNEFFYEHIMIDENLVGAKVFHLTLSFDHTVTAIPCSTVELGDLFDGLDEDSVTTFYTRLRPDSNHIDIDIAYLRDSAVLNGPGELLTITAVPKAFGVTDIMVDELLVFDRYNQPIPVDVINRTFVRICQYVGDVNADNSIDIRDVVYLVEYMFLNGPEPLPSVWSGNFNCDASPIDISDLVSLVNWMFQQGPWLCQPPCVEEP